ncbi:10971_t:CDS:2, partial [Dentiscutata erythropus]
FYQQVIHNSREACQNVDNRRLLSLFGHVSHFSKAPTNVHLHHNFPSPPGGGGSATLPGNVFAIYGSSKDT